MPNNSSKIKDFIDEIKIKGNLELANAELLKLFGDEETYNRYVLFNYNKHLTSAFATTRSDGLYISMEMALRNFDGSYQDFAMIHNAYKFDYPVVQTALDNFYWLEVGMFCCGAKDTTNCYRKVGYTRQYDAYGETVVTPQVVKVDINHPNYNKIKALKVDRQKNLPILYMDDKTISAFTYFRIMVYNKTQEYLERGVSDIADKLNLPRFYNRNNNPYICYAIALKETCEYFKTFYNPNKVAFTNTSLPYKGLGVIETKVNNIKSKYNIDTIGTIRHFPSAGKLPMLYLDLYDVTKTITKMVTLKGQWVDEDVYKNAFNLNMNVITPPMKVAVNDSASTVSRTKQSANVEEIQQSQAVSSEIDKALSETTATIKNGYTYTFDGKLQESVKLASTRLQHYEPIQQKLITGVDLLRGILRETNKLSKNSDFQLPMFVEVVLGRDKYTIANPVGFIDSKYYINYVSNFNKVNLLFNKMINEYKNIVKLGEEIDVVSREYKIAKRDFENPPEKDKKQESEVYRWKDRHTGEFLSGNYEEYELARCEECYETSYNAIMETLKRVNEISSEFVITLKETENLAQEILQEKELDITDLQGTVEMLSNFESDLKEDLTTFDSDNNL